jgi:lysine 2,3-aminomutase
LLPTLRTRVAEGVDIIGQLCSHNIGYAIPQCFIDGSGGGGRIPVNPNYVVDGSEGKVTFRNYEGGIFDWPDPAPFSEGTMKVLREKALAKEWLHSAAR